MSPAGSFIRPAKVREAELLSDLAFRSKAHRGYSESFISACRDELRIRRPAVEAGRVFVIEREGVVVGFCSLEGIGGAVVEVGHLFGEPAAIGTGVGTRLLRHACSTASELDWRRLQIEGDPHAERFYRRVGERPIGKRESASIPGRQLPLFEIDLPCRRDP
jgi:GNAT superfamily N-acetyltransferase